MDRRVLIVLHGLACWLGHLGHSFGRAAVGFGPEIQGDDVARSGRAGGLERLNVKLGEMWISFKTRSQ